MRSDRDNGKEKLMRKTVITVAVLLAVFSFISVYTPPV